MSRTIKREVKKESVSKQLRSVFYRLWEKNDEGYDEFEKYYESKMIKLINHYRKLLK